MAIQNKTPTLTPLTTGILAGVGAAIIWGLWPVVTRFGVTTDFSPEAITVARFLFAGILLFPFYVSRKIYRRISPLRSLIISSGAGAIYVYVSALGLKFVPAGHLGIVETGTMLALSAVGGYLILGETKTQAQTIGYVFVFGGMLTVSWQSFSLPTANSLYGDLLLVFGGILWASYTILSKKWNLDVWDAVISVCVWSLIVWIPPLLWFGDVTISIQTLPSWLFQGISQGFIAAILGLWLYSLAVRKLGAARGSLFGALVPAIAILGGLVFLGEMPTTLEIIGATLTIFGILISLRA